MKFAKNIVAGALIVTTGCSALVDRTQIVTVTTKPENATLMINGVKYHQPAQVPVPRDEPVVIQCEAAGFEPQERIIRNHMNTAGVLDVFGFLLFLLPGLGLLTPGSHSLDETVITMDLYHPYVAPTPAPPVSSPHQK